VHDSRSLEIVSSLLPTPNLFLDEWEKDHFDFDPFDTTKMIGLGTYMIHEGISSVPSTLKLDDDSSGPWKMLFDGVNNRNGAGVGVLLISLTGKELHFSHKLQFSCTNNITKYEAFVHGMLIAKKKKIKHLEIFGEINLVVNQVRERYATKN